MIRQTHSRIHPGAAEIVAHDPITLQISVVNALAGAIDVRDGVLAVADEAGA